MGSTYVGWSIVFFLLSLAGAGGIQFYYVSRSWRQFPAFTTFCIFMSVFVCILPFPLLVLDVDAAHEAVEAGLTENKESWFKDVWWTIMVVTQGMAWAFLPIAQEYDRAGDFTVKGRLSRSVKENVKMYIIMGVIGGLLLVYVIFLKGLTSFTDVLTMCFAASNAFGMFIICVFLASGLVGIPKLLWRSSDPETTLRRYYFEATDIQEDLEMAAMDLRDIKAELAAIDPRVSDEHRVHLAVMMDHIARAEQDVPLYKSVSSRLTLSKFSAVNQAEDVSLNHLVDLHMRLKNSVKIVTRMNHMWETTLSSCRRYDAIVSGGGHVENGSPGDDEVGAIELAYWKYVRYPLLRVLSVGSFILTILILWSELVLPFHAYSDSPLGVIELVMKSRFHFVGSVTFLFYMAGCCYWAVFQFKVFEVYHLLPHVSDVMSFCFTATFLTRLLMPLCYNFLWASDLTTADNMVMYSAVFGAMNVVNFLGTWFNQFMPIFIPVVALLIETKLIDRVLTTIVGERLSANDIHNPIVMQKTQDGKRLIMAAIGHEVAAAGSGGLAGAGTTSFGTISGIVSSGSTTGREMDTIVSGASTDKGKRYAEYKAKRAALQQGKNSEV